MPDALPLTGLFGKVPAHGDFVRRALPTSFVGPWDSWLQDGMATAREALGDRWASCWDGAPPWRFALPAGACGPDAVAGVMLPSEDMVGRRFPITLAVLLPPGAPIPAPAWFAALEAAALAGRAGQADADALAVAIPLPGHEPPDAVAPTALAGWSPAEPEDPLPFAPAPESGAVPPIGDVLGMTSGLPDAPNDLLEMFGEGRARVSEVLSPDSMRGVPGMFEGPVSGEPIDPPEGDAPGSTGSVLDMFGGSIGPSLPEAADVPESAPAVGLFGIVGADEAAAATDSLAAAAAPPGDVLDFFSRASSSGEIAAAPEPRAAMPGNAAPPHMATPDAPEPATPDGTLAFLLGEGGTAPASDPAGDPWAALIGAGEAGRMSPAGIAMPAAVPAMPIPMAFDLPPPLAPAPPEYGGWWTRGGGRLPPTVRALPALIPAGAFASLLEADA